MKKTIKEHRKIKQLSQQELSGESGISIRTIQRIEKNLSKGSPYVIKSLCKALHIETDDLELHNVNREIDVTEIHKEAEKDEVLSFGKVNYQWEIKLINLSSILVLLFPLLNLLIPAILYWKYKASLNRKLDALKILSFQILWTFLTLTLLVLIPAIIQLFFGMFEISGYPLFIWIYFLSIFSNILITIVTAIRLNKSEVILTYIPNIL